MKFSRFAGMLIGILLMVSFTSPTGLAQDKEQEKAIEVEAKKQAQENAAAKAQLAEMESKLKTELSVALGAKFNIETKLVKGAPYSAVAVSESVQVLGDGNRIRQTTTTTVYRDSAGRIRREVTKKDGSVQSIVISDPSTGVNYSLDPQRRTAMKNESPVMMKKIATVPEEELQRRREIELKAKLEAEKKVAAIENSASTVPLKKRVPVKEPLGRQTIEGIEAEGTRITTVIPAGEIGNDLPINIVSEQWYSPELQLLVMTKHSDPRTGETTYRLTNINRAEPDRSLFEVPGDYTIRTVAEEKRAIEVKRMKTEKPEDQQ